AFMQLSCFRCFLLDLYLYSFPTRRSSDLGIERHDQHAGGSIELICIRSYPSRARGGQRRKTWRASGRAWSRWNMEGSDRFGKHRSEEHTSELQSLAYIVCRLLLETKKTTQ